MKKLLIFLALAGCTMLAFAASKKDGLITVYSAVDINDWRVMIHGTTCPKSATLTVERDPVVFDEIVVKCTPKEEK